MAALAIHLQSIQFSIALAKAAQRLLGAESLRPGRIVRTLTPPPPLSNDTITANRTPSELAAIRIVSGSPLVQGAGSTDGAKALAGSR